MSSKISCKQAVDFISKKEEGRLSRSQRFQLWQHLAICSLCRIFQQQQKIITKTLAQLPAAETVLTEADKKLIIENVLNQEE